ncbi:Uncharacterised protein [Serratia fonticola]|uniref:Uncharacterized protein n=1 Tax=Serratia fonticola TaxID=47917 RepID=A0A4V6KRI2_SERFO|nr:Uncharacterised protein [Serratia fonticola]
MFHTAASVHSDSPAPASIIEARPLRITSNASPMGDRPGGTGRNRAILITAQAPSTGYRPPLPHSA